MSTIYIHWPFCLSKCFYCDFHSIPCRKNIDYSLWLAMYKNVLMQYRTELYPNDAVTSVYFGGGTPSLLPESFVGELLNFIRSNFKLENDAEITIEANPKTIFKEKMKVLKSFGVNRISIGVQSFVDEDLKILGRIHNSKEAMDCLQNASEVFENISLDLIYNRPGQILTHWEEELRFALTLPIKHISLYELIIEDGTKIQKMICDGEIPAPDSGSDFMLKTFDITKKFGFEMYEVSNFSKPGYEGRHNLSYWKYEDYFGVGPSSHSRIFHNGKKLALEQISDNDKWLLWAQRPELLNSASVLTDEEIFQEKLIFGLRSKVGFDLNNLDAFFEDRLDLKNKVGNLAKNSYIILEDGIVKLTQEGLLKLNLIIEYLARKRTR